jgi:ABC-type nitrate/sulfonate/bicarbonate transport system permease component
MASKLSDLFELRVQPPRLARWLFVLSAVLLVLLCWWFLTVGGEAESRIISPVILPSPAEVVSSASSLLTERALLKSVTATLQRVLLGFALAVGIGVPLGVLAGAWRGMEAFFAPISLFGRNIPIAALVPLTIVWFKTGEYQKVMFIFIACVPFVFGKDELDAQEQRLAAAMKAVESDLDDALHAKVTTLLVELTAYDIMRTLHELQAEKLRSKFQ